MHDFLLVRAGVDMKRMESKAVKGLFFAGELLDVDGITGGFNFQSAWTTGWTAGRSIGEDAAQMKQAQPEAGSA
jgi:predicted flavoprotein YhiN